MKKLIMTIVAVAGVVCVNAQSPAYSLESLLNEVYTLRDAGASKKACEGAIEKLADKGPAITLMDDVGNHSNEFKGKGDVKFHLNGVVGKVYAYQNGISTTKGDFYDSREKGIDYSLIEKTVKPRAVVRYKLTEHEGVQEIAVVPFKKDCTFSVTVKCNGVDAGKAVALQRGGFIVKTKAVKKSDIIEITIENKMSAAQSFAILNHNSRKNEK